MANITIRLINNATRIDHKFHVETMSSAGAAMVRVERYDPKDDAGFRHAGIGELRNHCLRFGLGAIPERERELFLHFAAIAIREGWDRIFARIHDDGHVGPIEMTRSEVSQ